MVFEEFADRGIASAPQRVEHALLQRPKLLRGAAKWMENQLHGWMPAAYHRHSTRIPAQRFCLRRAFPGLLGYVFDGQQDEGTAGLHFHAAGVEQHIPRSK